MYTFSELLAPFTPDCPENLTVMILGSSVADVATAHSKGWLHWGDYLEMSLKQLTRHASVINKAIGGNTTRDVLCRFGKDVAPTPARFTVFMIGGNDANPRKGISAEEFYSNMEKICLMLQAKGSVPVLQTYYCPNIDGNPDDMEHVKGTETNMESMRRLSAKYGWPLLDQYPVFHAEYMKDRGRYCGLLYDNWHLSEAGNIAVAKFLVTRMGLPEFTLNERLQSVWAPYAEMELK